MCAVSPAVEFFFELSACHSKYRCFCKHSCRRIAHMELNRQCPISLPLPAVGAPPQTPCSLRSHCEKNDDADAIIWRSIICLSTECVHRKHCFHNFFFDHSLDIVHAHHTDLVVVRGEIQKSSAKSLGLFINHSAPILVRSHQDIIVGWSKD